MKKKGATMMRTYLERDSDELDGFEFLTMAEAGEVGHWSVLQELNKQARHAGVRQLVEHAPADPAAAPEGRDGGEPQARGEGGRERGCVGDTLERYG